MKASYFSQKMEVVKQVLLVFLLSLQ